MNGFMFFLSLPANVLSVGYGSGEAKKPGGEMSSALIQIRFCDAEFGKISPIGQRKSTVRVLHLIDSEILCRDGVIGATVTKLMDRVINIWSDVI